MATSLAWVAGALAALWAPACLAATLEAYGKLPSIEDVQISPDGTRLAVVLTDGDQRNVAIERAQDQKVLFAISAGARKLREVRWAGSDHLLVRESTTSSIEDVMSSWQEWDTVVDVNVASRTQAVLLGDGKAGMNVVLDSPQVRILDGKPFAFVIGYQWVADEAYASLYKIDLGSGRSSVEGRGVPDTRQWVVDQAGDLLATTEFNEASRHWVLKLRRGNAWIVAKTVEAPIDQPFVMGLGTDGRTLLIVDAEGDNRSLRELPPNAVDWGPPTPMPTDEAPIFDPVTDALIGADNLVGDDLRTTFLSPADQASWNQVTRIFPGELVRLVSMSADRRKLVVLADSPTLGQAYCMVELETKSAKWLGPSYAALTPDDIAPKTPISFKAADGLELTGYLTLPRGRDPKGLPLVVLVHGGPAARDEPGFDWWAQAIASKGYAVLQVNYRGSDGFGWKFMSAGFGEWGGKMQTDLSDGVRFLAARQTIDPARVCIVGASYGGYAALAGATLDTGVYRCAVSVAGPADLARLVHEATRADALSVARYWDRYMGATRPEDRRLKDISPADHADRATIPILLIHGADDTVVPYEQSQFMQNALQRAGKKALFVTLNHEDHWLSHGDTRLQMLKATMDFLEEHNPPN